MRIVFAGTPEFAVPSLDRLSEAGHEVVGVITREDAPLGRKRVLTPSPVAVAAEKLGIPVHKANRLGEGAAEWVGGLAPDLGVIVAYGGLVRDPLLSLPDLGWINLHFSELPRWRGAAPVQRALMAGEQRLGVTVFRLVEALDAGDVLTRDTKEFQPGTPAGEALSALACFGTGALLQAVDALAADPRAGDPQLGVATYAHKLTRDDGRLDVSSPVSEMLAHWAGVTPEPGAYAVHGDAALKLLRVNATAEPSRGEPGAVVFAGDAAVLYATDGTLELTRVQPAGKAAMDGAAWLRGRGGSVVLS